MLPFKKVLCPTDFSEPAQAGLDAAVEMAAHFGATLHLVHVVPALPTPKADRNYTFAVPEYESALHAEALEKLQAIAGRLGTTAKLPEYTIGHGEPGREIVRVAGEWAADVIVIATHGETGWRHVLFGSVAERVVRQASCAVLTVRPPRH
jgi:nucleotide-binding universal stress UspA family protein